MQKELTNIAKYTDSIETELFYKTQISVLTDCNCSDCEYYQTVFIKKPLVLFVFLLEVKVDLSKNLNFEPTGVWIVRNENLKFEYCEQAFLLKGNFKNVEFKPFEIYESEFKTVIQPNILNDNELLLYVSIEKI